MRTLLLRRLSNSSPLWSRSLASAGEWSAYSGCRPFSSSQFTPGFGTDSNEIPPPRKPITVLRPWEQVAVAVGALVNPARADFVNALSETTGGPAFHLSFERMKASPEGQVELENLQRERELRSALGIDQKVAELEAFAEEAARDSSKKELFLAKLEEAVRGTYAGVRALQGQKILELNSSLEELARERDVTAKRAEEIEQEYLSLKSELQKLDDEFDDAKWEEREALSLSVEDAETRSGELWQKVSDLEEEMIERQMWMERAVYNHLPKFEYQGRAEFEQVYQGLLQSKSKDEVRTSETVSRIGKELEVARGTEVKQSLLPLAVGVVDDKELAEFEVDAETQELLYKIQREAT